MRFRRERHTHGIEFNMTPLIDIVFLLIIFLMTVQEFSRLELEEVDLPEADQSDVQAQPPQRVVINIRADGSIVVANQEMGLNRVLELLRAENERLQEAGRGADLTVIVRADESVPYSHVQDLLSGAASLNIWQVRVATAP